MGAAVAGSSTVAAICAKVIEAAGMLALVAGAGVGLGRDGDGARDRRGGAVVEGEGGVAAGLGEDGRLGMGAEGLLAAVVDWERMPGPAARTVSMAVDIAVCMGMLGSAVTVAATILAI